MGEKLRILILEDVPSDAELAKRELRKAGMSVVAKRVETRDAFLKELEESTPDLVLADYMLPQFHGMTALKLVQERAPHVPVIMFTGSIPEETAVEGIKAGAADSVLKTHLARLAPAVENALGRARDRAERLAAERALRASEERLKILFEFAPDAIYLHDLEGTFVDGNLAAERLTGYKREELIGRGFLTSQLLLPDQVLKAATLLAKSVLGKPTGPDEFVFRQKDGGHVTVEISTRPVRIHDRRLVLAVARDITERNRALEALRQSEEAARALFEYAIHGVYRSTLQGKFVTVNPALVEMLGYDSADDLLSIDVDRDLYADPAERARLIEHFHTTQRIRDVEVKWKRKDGDTTIVRLNGRPAGSSEGEFECFEMFVEDVSDRRTLEAQLRQAQKMEAIGQLTSGIAHDFNNLLSVTLLNTQAVAATLESTAPQVLPDLDDIEQAARRAAAMTKRLLGFSRRMDLAPVPTDVARLVTNLKTMLRPVIPEYIELRVTADDPVGAVMVDPGAVEQCVINLVTNARDAMPEGGDLLVEVREIELDEAYRETHPWITPGPHVCVSVSDTGIGMDESTKAKIFEPFFTTKGPDAGTGLGMAMVYGLTKQQAGYVHVYSEPGEGTTIRLCYPIIEAPAQAPAGRQSSTAQMTGGTDTILLVEDEDILRRAGKRVLERYGYTVITVADGAEALEVWRARRAEIDLVLSDMVMPRMSGAELYRHLEKEPDTPKFILASGYADRDVRDRVGLDPSVPMVRKPWEIDVLLTRVREELGR